MESEEKLLSKVKQIVMQCDRCGNCTTVCPLYRVDPIEKSVSRGKIAITRAFIEGGIQTNKELKKALDYCLLCRACTEVCPSKILTDEAMIEIREYLTRKTGTNNPFYKLVGLSMGNKYTVGFGSVGMGLARLLSLPKIFKLIPGENPTDTYQRGLIGPAQITIGSPNTPKESMKRIGYFKGCAMKMFFPQASNATVVLLKKQGDVEIPHSTCCGVPHLSHGMSEKYYKLAKENIELFKDFDVVVTDCATCGSVLKEYGQRLKLYPEYAEEAEIFSNKVMGLSEFLDATQYKSTRKLNARVTFHDPCHLNRAQGVKQSPRKLLQQAADYVEMPNADLCCGGAGTFQFDFAEKSQKILELKTLSISSINAQIVVTECPSCMMQLSKAEKDGHFKVMHISQVL